MLADKGSLYESISAVKLDNIIWHIDMFIL